MKIFIVAATQMEAGMFTKHFDYQGRENLCRIYSGKGQELHLCISGVGSAPMAWSTGIGTFQNDFDLAINVGIGGAYDKKLSVGEVCEVVAERWGDLGAEDSEGQFLDLTDLGLNIENELFRSNGFMENPNDKMTGLRSAIGLTVNKTLGTERSIQAMTQKYPAAQIESMEGAGFFYACLRNGIPFLELRAISNYVEVRNKDNWDIKLALNKLEEFIIPFLENISS